MSRVRRAALAGCIALAFGAGFLLGAAAIHRPIPGAPVELPPARQPWSPKDVMGLIGSAGIRTLSGNLEQLPLVVVETDTTFALALPAARNKLHYVLVPKKDIRDISGVSSDDQRYLADLFVTARHLVEKEGLDDYRIYTNGRGRQSVGYLHFHLVGTKSAPGSR
jgi:histidine triad (HIT) family protein